MYEIDSTMNIWQLEEYAQNHNGWKTGCFIAINERGIFEFQWLDAYFGLVQMITPKQDGFLSTDTLRKIFGDDQQYISTSGYDE